MVDIVQHYSTWLAHSPVPKLFINAEPGAIITGRLRELCRTWPTRPKSRSAEPISSKKTALMPSVAQWLTSSDGYGAARPAVGASQPG